MFKNYLVTFARNMIRYKLYSAINVLGLAVGIACCVLISAFVIFEMTYDRYHEKGDRIYRISRNFETGIYAINSAPAGPTLQEVFPQIEAYARIYHNQPTVVGRDDFVTYEEGVTYADNNVLTFFDFDWLAGNPETALLDASSIVINETLAEKHYPNEGALGQILEVDGKPFTVTGVFRDLPDNTHLDFKALMSWQAQTGDYESWDNTIVHTYILLQEGADIAELSSRLPEFVSEYVPPWRGDPTYMTAIRLADIHLHGADFLEFKPVTSPALLMILSAIGVCILAIACMNFMNLSTVRGAQRAKEVGMRKAVGASRGQLMRQFLSESVLVSTLAMLLAIGFVELVLPAFSNFVGREIDLNYSGHSALLLGLMGGAVLIGVMAGAYPAFFLSAFKPTKALKGNYSRGNRSLLRNGMVVLQFSISIALIVSTVVMVLQMNLVRERHNVLDLDRVVMVSRVPEENRNAFKQTLASHPSVEQVSSTAIPPFGQQRGVRTISRLDEPDRKVDVYGMRIDFDFFEVFDIPIVAGRGFIEGSGRDLMVPPTPDNPLTTTSFILNESAARRMGWSADDAIGQLIQWDEPQGGGGTLPVQGSVVGVVADYSYESIYQPVKPRVFLYDLRFASTYLIRVAGDDLPETLAFIDDTWADLWPDTPIDRQFLEAAFYSYYQSYFQQGRLVRYFAGIAVILACFGLFGLASYNTERRIKEIGIRKVMGGSVTSIVLLLTKDFCKLVLISNVIAWPVAYLAMQRWLESFAYRVEMDPLIFVSSGLVALCIAWMTVGVIAVRAGNGRPVLALRYE